MTTARLAAIYARVSTERQAVGDKTSLERQVKTCERTAGRLGLTVVGDPYTIKEAHSASDPDDRPGLERLYEGARRGAFRYVLMDVIDRTTRAGPFNLVDICKRFLDLGVRPIWAGHPDIDLTTAEGQIEAAKLAIRAYEDKQTIARRFQEGKGQRIEDGQLIRAYLAYGYRWNAERPAYASEFEEDPRTEWVPDEEPPAAGGPPPASVVRRIYSYLAEGWRTGGDASAVKIADALAGEGVPPPSVVKGRRRRSERWNGKPARWQFGMIGYLVSNPTYKGQRPQNRWQEVPRDAKERKDKGLKTPRRVIERPADEWNWVAVPALVDEATWEDANKQLARNVKHNHRQPKRYTPAEVLLSGGYVRCALCDHSMVPYQRAASGTRGGRGVTLSWYYHCPRLANTDPRCPGVAVLAREVDRFVWAAARRIISDPAYLRSRLTRTDEAWSPDDQIAHYERLMADCDAKERALYYELEQLRGNPALDGLRRRILDDAVANDADRKKATAKRDAARAEKERRATRDARLETVIARVASAADHLTDLTPDQRRAILLDLHPTVHVARRDDATEGTPRLAVVFDLSEDARVHRADPGLVARYWTGRDGATYAIGITTPQQDSDEDAVTWEDVVDWGDGPKPTPAPDTTGDPRAEVPGRTLRSPGR